jgi:hypothetical protein
MYFNKLASISMAALLAASAQASGDDPAQVLHSYSFNGTLGDSVGGVAMEGNGGVIENGRYLFDGNQGLTLRDALLDVNDYAVEVGLRIDAAQNFYVKLLDFANLSLDDGLYIAGEEFIFYPITDLSSRNILPGEDFVFVLSQDANGQTRGYVDGNVQFTIGGGANAVPLDNILHIMLDDDFTGNLETATGSIDYVRVYDRALTNEEVAALGPPPPDILGDTIESTLTFASSDNNFWVFATDSTPLAATVQAQAPEYSDPALGFYNLIVDIEQNVLTIDFVGLTQVSVAGTTLTLTDLDFETDLLDFVLTSNTFPSAPDNIAVTAADGVTLRLPTINGLMPGDTYQMTFEFVTERSADPDGDGVPFMTDNCLEVTNPDQTDSDGDGFGNACDADLNNDCIVNFVDLGLLRTGFFGTPGETNWNPDADFNDDAVVNFQDLGQLRAVFFETPGPGAGASCDN